MPEKRRELWIMDEVEILEWGGGVDVRQMRGHLHFDE